MNNNRNVKMLAIKGISGIILLIIAIIGIVGGFILFPIWLILHGWNSIMVSTFHLPAIEVWQAVILWAISYFVASILLKDSIAVNFQSGMPDEGKSVDEFMDEIKEMKKAKEDEHKLSQETTDKK